MKTTSYSFASANANDFKKVLKKVILSRGNQPVQLNDSEVMNEFFFILVTPQREITPKMKGTVLLDNSTLTLYEVTDIPTEGVVLSDLRYGTLHHRRRDMLNFNHSIAFPMDVAVEIEERDEEDAEEEA